MMAMPLAPRGRTPFSSGLDRLSSGHGNVICGTGDSFVTAGDPWLVENDIDIVDMELFAIAHVCQRHSVPWRAFKFITDDANDFAADTGPRMSPTARICSGMRLTDVVRLARQGLNNPPAPDKARPAARPGRRRRGRGRRARAADRRRSSGLRRPTPASRPSSAPGCAGTSAPRSTISTSSPSRDDVELIERLLRRFRLAFGVAECGEIVLADQTLCRLMHRIRIERPRHAPDLADFQREVGAAVDDAIEVMPPVAENRASNVVRHDLRRQHADRMRPQMSVERVAHACRLRSAFADVEMRDLPQRMHAGIGAARAVDAHVLAGRCLRPHLPARPAPTAPLS